MDNFSEKIYKLDSKGKERVLHVYTVGAELVQESGLVDGAKVEHRKTCTPKNVGKSNETTAQEQAVSQAKSKIEEKLTEGYFKTLQEANSIEVILPMLADDYKEKSKKINWLQVYVQPKLDGMRCLIIVKNGQVRLMSRAGKDIITMQHIIDEVSTKITPTSKFILDGELYSTELGNFQETMRAIKKVGPETTKIKFHMYDIVSDKPFIERHGMLLKIKEHWKF